MTALARTAARASKPTPAPALPTCVLNAHGQLWQLCGRGIYVWTVFRCYWASLYTRTGHFDSQEPAILDLEYLRTLSREQTVTISVDEIRRLRPESAESTDQWRASLKQIIPDVTAGERLIGYFDPATGVSFYSAEHALGDIVDKDFASAFLAIWLDPATRAPDLRAALLGHSAVPALAREVR
jgi:hypothetical protein